MHPSREGREYENRGQGLIYHFFLDIHPKCLAWSCRARHYEVWGVDVC
jgi:hypothetical protein